MKINSNYQNNYKNKTCFTAQIKGPAVLSAIKKAKEFSELGEIREVIENVKNIGDLATEIYLENSGLVKVSNKKFNKVVDTFNYRLNENLENPYLEMLKSFNTMNKILKCEVGLLENIFSHSKNKKSIYDLYSTYNLSSMTKIALDNVASKSGIIESKTQNNKFKDIEVLKRMMFPDYIKD